jgi:hypothetical protein
MTHRLVGDRPQAAPLGVSGDRLRQFLALRLLDIAGLMLRAAAILLLLSPAVIGALLIYG